MSIPDSDLKVECWPERGKGGQHVGTETGVKITHLPSGIITIVNIGRSQHKNRTIAINMIEAAITHPDFR